MKEIGGGIVEARKKVKPIVVILIIFAFLLLALCSSISAGITNLQPFDLRYGLRVVADNSLTGGVNRGDLVFLDQDAVPQTGSVVYLPEKDVYQGVFVVSGSQVKLTDGTTTDRFVPVNAKLTFLAPVLCFLQDYPAVSFGVTAGFAVFLLVMKTTAPKRWRKRQQKIIRENLEKFGAQYAKEDAEKEY